MSVAEKITGGIFRCRWGLSVAGPGEGSGPTGGVSARLRFDSGEGSVVLCFSARIEESG